MSPEPIPREPISRAELLDSYAHPYRRWLPVALKGYGVHYLAGLTVLAAVAGLVGTLADAGFADAALSIAMFGVVAIVCVSLWALVHGVRIIRDRTWQWRSDRGDDLAEVRRLRPHAADADAEVANVEYAVSVEENGEFVTWAFEPLLASDDWDEEAVLITGVPRYEARAVERVAYDPTDQARASEQLVEAQQKAAVLEADEIVRTRLELEQDAAARELMTESLATGDALRGATGQRRR
jgi:hypothetical protein